MNYNLEEILQWTNFKCLNAWLSPPEMAKHIQVVFCSTKCPGSERGTECEPADLKIHLGPNAVKNWNHCFFSWLSLARIGYLDWETGKVKWNTIKAALQFHVCNLSNQEIWKSNQQFFYSQGGHLPQKNETVVCWKSLEILKYWR